MRQKFAFLFAAPALALVALVGCGGGDKDKKTTTPPEKKGAKEEEKGKGGAAASGSIKPGDGKIVGRVVYDGTAPKMQFIADIDKHGDKKTCHAGSEHEKIDQTWMIGKDNGVQNVVVWLSAGKGKFDVVETKGAVEVDQPHCVYVPHVLVIKPGQFLKVKNSADVLHNTKWEVDSLAGNVGGGQTIAPKGTIEKVELKPQDAPISLRCDIHKWMEAFVWVVPHQYVAVTGPDGTFTIDNVPTGMELSVVAWHENAGYFYGGKKGTAKTFTSGDNKLDLKVSAK